MILALFLALIESTSPKPDKMTELDASRLDASLSHVREIDRAIADLGKKRDEEAKAAADILRRWSIDLVEFAQGKIGIDFKTGKITRLQASPQPKTK